MWPVTCLHVANCGVLDTSPKPTEVGVRQKVVSGVANPA